MTTEHDLAHGRAAPRAPSLADDDLVPGRGSRSSQLAAPSHPIAGGLLLRKARDGNGVAEGAEQAVAAAGSSPGHPLPEAVQRKFESSLGTDLSGVRVHTGAESQIAAESVGAKAYTVGQDIHFGGGQYDPSSAVGQHLLAHEVAHTVQQAHSGQRRQNKLEVSTPGDVAETEADRAADAMVSGQTTGGASFSGVMSRAVVHRVLDEDQKKQWDDEKGDILVQQLKSEVARWKEFRQNPTSYNTMPGQAVAGIADQLEELFSKDSAFRANFIEQLGRESAPYLREMVSINHSSCDKLESLGLATYVDPVHKWTMKINANGTVASVGGFLPISTLVIEYTNSLGWYYSKPLAGAMIGFSVSIGKKQGEPPKAGAKLGPTKVSINGTADATSITFWGPDNLPGMIVVAGGPSGSATVGGFGGKLNAGSLINLVGNNAPNSPLHFQDFEGDASLVHPKPPKSPKDVRGIEPPTASITFTSEATGLLGPDPSQPTMVATPEPTPQVVPMTDRWEASILGFETGEDQIPASEINGPLQQIKVKIDQRKNLIEADKTILIEEFNIDQEFKLQFDIIGAASRIWTNAASDAERKRLNQQLSARRAETVAASCRDLFGSNHIYTSSGVGAGVDIGTDVIFPEAGNEAALEAMRAKRLAEAKKQFPTMSEEDLRKKVDENIGKNSNQPSARRVEVKVSWSGNGIQWGQNASPVPHELKAPDANGGNGRGPGGRQGQEGAGSTDDDGSGQGGNHG